MPAEISAIIVDDEAPARSRIRALLRDEPDIAVVAECAGASEALHALRRFRAQLVFLDVQMPGENGFDVLGRLAPHEVPSAIVMVTAHDDYALRAFDVSAADYLLKPYTEARFFQALHRAREKVAARTPDTGVERLLRAIGQAQPERQRLALRSREGVQFVDAQEVDWLEADGNYAVLHVGRNHLRVRETIADLEKRLAPAFVRIHRSLLVNHDRIVRVEPWASGEYLIVLRDGTKMQSGRTYSGAVRALLSRSQP